MSHVKLPSLPPMPPAAIRIVGLGPGALGDLSLAAWQALASGAPLILRTSRHPLVEQLGLPFTTCDDLYETHDEFAAVYAAIADRVIAAAQSMEAQTAGCVVYAVPGHPWVGEATTRLILPQAAAAGLTVQVIGGQSFIEPTFAALQVDCMDGGQVIDAMLLSRQHHPKVEVGLPLLVAQLYAQWLAAQVKLTLLNAYPPDHPVTLVYAAGTPQERLERRPLHEIDHGDDFDHLTTLYLPPLENGSFSDLHAIIAHLRAPEGCPWDQRQTLESLRQDLLGECAEVLEAIDAEADGADNSRHIAEELGDLYLVATMLVQIAVEEGRFQMADVMQEVVTKLIRRHPHVFGNTAVAGVAEIVSNWDAIKAAEKAANGETVRAPLDGVPAHLPALEKARVLQKKAEKAGLLQRAQLASGAPRPADAPLTAEALGELLWRIVALAHAHDLNAEDALRAYAGAYRAAHATPMSPPRELDKSRPPC